MKWNDFTVTVPASTANLGPGFDSIGLALDLHLTIHVSENTSWEVEYANEDYQHLPSSSANLIVETAEKVAGIYGKRLQPAKLWIETDIPLGRGLGSSASAIAGGIEIADRLLGLHLNMQEKVRIGTEMEGHPDNISAALLGGVTISYADDGELAVVHVPRADIGIIILVPQEVLLTTESRGLLPENMDYKKAISSSAAANVVSAAIVSGDWQTAGRMMEKDEFHEPYRKAKFPGFEEIRSVCREAGAYGSAVSGAGPSLFIATEQGKEPEISERLRAQFPQYKCLVTKPSETGIKSVQTVL